MRYVINDGNIIYCDKNVRRIIDTYGLLSNEMRSVILINRIQTLKMVIDEWKAELKELGVDYE